MNRHSAAAKFYRFHRQLKAAGDDSERRLIFEVYSEARIKQGCADFIGEIAEAIKLLGLLRNKSRSYRFAYHVPQICSGFYNPFVRPAGHFFVDPTHSPSTKADSGRKVPGFDA